MVNQFRPIFEQFKDLNLFVLRENLRLGRVIYRHWNGPGGLMCPYRHGTASWCRNWIRGVSAEACTLFVQWWDMKVPWWDLFGVRRRRARHQLLQLVESILAERLADADAMQQILEPQEVCV